MKLRTAIRLLGTAPMLFSAPALAGSIESELEAMNARMAQMEQELLDTQQELDNANERVDEQQKLIDEVGIDGDARSGLSAFLSETEFSGHIATSYNYNFNDPEPSAYVISDEDLTGGRVSTGNHRFTAPFHGQPNNFQLDQFLLEMKKEATPESRAGWGFSMAWGESADVMNGVAAFSGFGGDDDDDDDEIGDTLISPYIHNAYVDYLANIGGYDANIRLGRFSSPIGLESFSTAENDHITMGLLWALQPVDHTGLMVSGKLLNDFDWSLGVANDFGNTNIDSDRSKSFIGHIGYSQEKWGVKLGGFWGGNLSSSPYGAFYNNEDIVGPGTDRDSVGVFDFSLTASPCEKLDLWAGFDYFWSENSENWAASSLSIWGAGIGGRYAITEKTGIALRTEYLRLDNANATWDEDGEIYGGAGGASSYVWAITGTVDHALTENLTVRGEVRYDRGNAEDYDDNFYVENSNLDDDDRFFGPDQVLAVIQLLYRF